MTGVSDYDWVHDRLSHTNIKDWVHSHTNMKDWVHDRLSHTNIKDWVDYGDYDDYGRFMDHLRTHVRGYNGQNILQRVLKYDTETPIGVHTGSIGGPYGVQRVSRGSP